MQQIDYISVRGFRSISSLEKVHLGSVNVLIGANGAGKSNFLEVFALLQAIGDGRLFNYVGRVGGAERLLHFGSSRTESIELEFAFRNPVRQLRLRLVPSSEDELFVSEGTSSVPEEAFGGSRAAENNPAPNLRIYHFQDTGFHSPMKKTAKLHDNRYLRADASNLAAFLYLLRERYTDSYRLIQRTIQRVAPFFDDFQLEPIELTGDTILLEWRHVGSEAYFDAGSLSDGTLRFMALSTLLLQPIKFRPSTIILDEPELGLHPFAIAMLAGMIKQAAVDTQIVVSTQSSLLLDHFEPEDVLVADRQQGATTLTRLDPKDLEDWLEDYSLGQLWEKNQFGGRPRAA